ncbi:FecR domain-containing protein [uncultured Draconibacterium sp.]|uniref:FecR family protein n=1 Tax=uncultured Draconibacterium sp. TaxID=1573823 RepID=UPI0032167DE3
MKNNSENNMSQEEFRQMNSEEKILQMASGLVPPEGRTQKEALDLLLNKIEETTPTRTIGLKRYFQIAAAVIIILIGFRFLPATWEMVHTKTDFAQQTELTLPDGSDVILNAGSQMTWNKKRFNKERQLKLKGEAYFNVKKGDQFIIKTKNGTVEVLGTQLNVFSRGEEFWVSCISGRVKVSSKNSEQIITPGEKVELNKTELTKSKSESIENTAMWKDGVCHFEESQLDAIFAELERQFNVSVSFEGDKKRKATIDFSNQNLHEALDVICIPMGLSYEIENTKIKISENQ